MSYRRFFETVFLFIPLFAALAFGGARPLPLTVLELSVAVLFSTFLMRMLGRNELRVHSPALFLPMLVFLALCIAQFLLVRADPSASQHYPHTLYRYGTRHLLLLLLSYLLFFYAAIHSFRGLRQIERMIVVLSVFGLALSLFSIVQKLSGTGRAYWHTRLPSGFFGPFFNANNLANYVMMIFLMTLGYVIYLYKGRRWRFVPVSEGEAEEPGNRSFKRPSGPKTARLPLFVFSLGVMFAAIVYSGSRGGMIITVFSSLVVLIVSFRKWISNGAAVGLLAVVLAGTAASTVMWVARQPMYEAGGDGATPEQLELRSEIWRHSLGVVRRNPFFGTGLGTYREAVKRHLPWDFPLARDNRYLTHAHNDYLELLSDTGIVGFLLFISFAILLVAAIIRRIIKRRSLFARTVGYSGCGVMLAMGVHSLIDFNLRVPANGYLFTAICAMTYFATHCRRDGSVTMEMREVNLSGRYSIAARAAVIIFAVLLSCVITLPLIAKIIDPLERYFVERPSRIGEVDTQELIRRLELSVKLDGLNASHRFHLAKARENGVRSLLTSPSGVVFGTSLYEDIESVFREYGQALEVQNTDAQCHMNLGFFYIRFVDYPEISEHLRSEIPLPKLEDPAVDLDDDNIFMRQCYAHLQYAVNIDESRPNHHRGLYMGCFYLYERVHRESRRAFRRGDGARGAELEETGEKLLALGKAECRKLLEVFPRYKDENNVTISCIRQALKYFAEHVTTDPDELESILAEKFRPQFHAKYFDDALLDIVSGRLRDLEEEDRRMFLEAVSGYPGRTDRDKEHAWIFKALEYFAEGAEEED